VSDSIDGDCQVYVTPADDDAAAVCHTVIATSMSRTVKFYYSAFAAGGLLLQLLYAHCHVPQTTGNVYT
jgi:hypothetical protein